MDTMGVFLFIGGVIIACIAAFCMLIAGAVQDGKDERHSQESIHHEEKGPPEDTKDKQGPMAA